MMDSVVMHAVGKEWWEFVEFKDSRLKHLDTFLGRESFSIARCGSSKVRDHKAAVYLLAKY